MDHEALTAHLLMAGGSQGLWQVDASWYPRVRIYNWGVKTGLNNATPERIDIILRERERAAAKLYYSCLVDGIEKFSTNTPEKVWNWVQDRLACKEEGI